MRPSRRKDEPHPDGHGMTTQTAPADERWGALHDLDAWLRTPMLVLSFVWLILVLAELTWGTSDLLETFDLVIWVAVLAEFALRFTLAPAKSPSCGKTG
jgi:voltage-gated potassium channel